MRASAWEPSILCRWYGIADRRLAAVAASLLLSILVSACAGPRHVPVVDQSVGLRRPESTYRVVVPGDTLYSLAWESGRDYHDLAAWNHIPPPYTLHPGQRVRLYPPRAAAPPPARARSAARAPKRDKPHAAPARRPPAARVGRWVWPAHGTLLNYASAAARNGIDIAGRRGQPVVAAAAGRVVYAGSGLRGYGRLIIIKHNETYLSAYAHNDKLYVKEGEVVKAGQHIADMGDSGAERVALHFEIRKRGVPVDPLQYLPKK